MTALLGSFPAAHHSNVFCFSVTAAAEPSVMPRLTDVFAQLGLVPDKWYATRGGRNGEDLVVDIQMGRLDAVQATTLPPPCARSSWSPTCCSMRCRAKIVCVKPADADQLIFGGLSF